MPDQRTSLERASLLADVAEMYYLEEMNQNEIAKVVGVTRSMVSRILSEARRQGIVEVRIHRPLEFDRGLENALVKRFTLHAAHVVTLRREDDEHLLQYLGKAGAELLLNSLSSETVLGIAWGTSVSAVVDQIEVREPCPIKIVQLVGALGARNKDYDGHGLVQRLEQNLGGEGYFLNAPFICPNPEVARSLIESPGVREAVMMSRRVTTALVGVGSVQPDHSSFYLAGYVPIEDINQLIDAGAVGDVCGLHFDIQGREICDEFCERLITIPRETLMNIPTRIGVAGGPGKAIPILGALQGGYINVLATDSLTARRVLEMAGQD